MEYPVFRDKSMTPYRVLAILMLSLAVLLTAIWARSEPAPIASPPACDLHSAIRAMEQYGRVSVCYINFKWGRDFPDPWHATFKSDRDLPLQLELEVRGATVCDTVDELYDKWYQIPFKDISNTRHPSP